MKFELLDRYMRRFELERQYSFPPEMYIVVQLRGQEFPALMQKKDFKRPYDGRLKELMIETASHLMKSKLSIQYGYTFGDEISLFIPKSMDNLGRRARKISSLLASQASGKFSLLVGEVVAFDVRNYQLPNEDCVVDYFCWRREEALRCSLHKYSLYLLEQEGLSPKEASKKLAPLGPRAKEKLLAKKDCPLSSIPLWQRQGVGLLWEKYQQEGVNPQGQKITFWRKRIKLEENLSLDQETYRNFIEKTLLLDPRG